MTDRRGLLVAVVALLVAAAALGGSSALSWGVAPYAIPLRGTVAVAVTGAQTAPSLGPLALVALAGVAAVLAVGGWARRLTGVVLAAAAVAPLLAVFAGDRAVRDAAGVDLPAGSTPDGAVDGAVVGPALAVVGAAMLVGVGVLLVVRGHRLPRLGGRYRATARQRVAAEPDRALWDQLDEGRDPTADPAADGTADPAGEPTTDPR